MFVHCEFILTCCNQGESCIQSDWFGTRLYDLIHPDDVEKLREQLSTSESQNTGRILDLKSRYLVDVLYDLVMYDLIIP